MRFIYFIYANATRDLIENISKKRVKLIKFMNKSSFFIAGQHAVIEALRNPRSKGFKSIFN